MLYQRTLGTSQIDVSVVGLGGNTFGTPRLDQDATIEVIDAALDLGVNFVDTANIYGNGQSEEFLGVALQGRRDQMVVATKFNLLTPSDAPLHKRIIDQLDASLARLRTEYVDLYQIHMPPPDLDTEELNSVLADIVAAGKALATGACNYSAWRLERSRNCAETSSGPRFSSVQNYYNLLDRGIESEIAPWCRSNETSILPYFPLGGGFLTGKYRAGEPPPAGTRGAAGSGIVNHIWTAENQLTLTKLEAFCAERDRPIGQLAIAWLLANETVASVISGVSNTKQLASNVGAASWALTAAEKVEVDAIVGSDAISDPERPPHDSKILERERTR
jgi:aryl-alcohol dehydrogenase-like predicted oxidoreductase